MKSVSGACYTDLFTLIWNIVGQTSKTANLYGRMLDRYSPITPETIMAITAEEIQKWVSNRKYNYIKGIAEAVVQGKLNLSELEHLPDDEVIKRLSSLPGIGVWTAEMLMIFSMQRPDVVSWGDLAIRRGMMTLYGLKDLTRERFHEYRKRYSPYGSVASLYLWVISRE